MVFVFTGNGAVSKGAQEVFEQLPHKYITPAELKQMFATQSSSSLLGYFADGLFTNANNYPFSPCRRV